MGSGGKPDASPTTEELELLPRWALVAFAARCAERVQRLYVRLWDGASPEVRQMLDLCLFLSVSAARNPDGANAADFRAVQAMVSPALTAGESAYTRAIATKESSGSKDFEIHDGEARSIMRALLAGRAAACVADVVLAALDHRRAAGMAFAITSDAADAVTDLDSQGFRFGSSARRDFEVLRRMAETEGWTDETPVDAGRLGALWPFGEPEGWPEDERTKPKAFRFVLDPGEADAATVLEVLTALSDLHEAHTGYALRYEEEGSLVAVPEEVEA